MSDILQRVVAELNTVDLEDGEEKSGLVWNVVNTSLRLDFVNDPEVFPALEDLLGDDLAKVQSHVDVGDDVELTGTWNYSKKSGNNGRPVGIREAYANADEILEYALLGPPDSCAAHGTHPGSRLEEALSEIAENRQITRELLATLDSTLRRAVMEQANVNEFLVSGAYRWRADEVGPSSWRVNARYSYGDKDPTETQAQFACLREAAQKGKRDGGCEKVREDSAGGAAGQRLAGELEYRRDEAYVYTMYLDAPLKQQARSYLKATLAYSLTFGSDDQAPNLLRPRYELRAAYERSDDAQDAVNRWVVSGIVTKAIPLFGSSTDLTVGLVYANRGEYLLEEDPERTFGANLGLKLKLGKNHVSK
jgi:hypothetical protein